MFRWPLGHTWTVRWPIHLGWQREWQGNSHALLCSFDIFDGILFIALQAWENSVGIISFPSLQRLAQDTSNQLAQEIQKALVGKPAGKRTVYGEETALHAPPGTPVKPLCFLVEQQ